MSGRTVGQAGRYPSLASALGLYRSNLSCKRTAYGKLSADKKLAGVLRPVFSIRTEDDRLRTVRPAAIKKSCINLPNLPKLTYGFFEGLVGYGYERIVWMVDRLRCGRGTTGRVSRTRLRSRPLGSPFGLPAALRLAAPSGSAPKPHTRFWGSWCRVGAWIGGILEMVDGRWE